MFTLAIEYLCGYAVATDPASRSEAEWPPHPGRVFMALAATHFETGGDAAERVALEWLESLGSPHVHAAPANARAVLTSYVPVNDVNLSNQLCRKTRTAAATLSASEAKTGLTLLPQFRPSLDSHGATST